MHMKGLDIKSFIERAGIKSQEELAERLKVTNVTVSMWANGTRTPTFKVCQQLLEMGMTVEELFGKPYRSSANQAKDDFDRKANFFMNKLFEKIDKL